MFGNVGNVGNVGKCWEMSEIGRNVGNARICRDQEIVGKCGKFWDMSGNVRKFWDMSGNVGKVGNVRKCWILFGGGPQKFLLVLLIIYFVMYLI